MDKLAGEPRLEGILFKIMKYPNTFLRYRKVGKCYNVPIYIPPIFNIFAVLLHYVNNNFSG